ncbi:MAG: hypothetical protein LQ349_000752 [Xanthoria aureola]|nr:MAG: hypothetical protein LQ349_000752 [Xanthoria aureola]
MGSTAADANAELGSRPATVASPSPLSQSISAEGTTGTLSTVTGVGTGLPQSAAESSVKDGQKGEHGNVSPITSDQPLPDIENQATSSPSLTTHDHETELVRGTVDSGLSGSDSPDARLEKEYHREKERNDEITNNDRDRGSSSDEDSTSRGRQRNREKKQYRKESHTPASDTDAGSSKETTTSSGKTPPPRKLKTFEPLREKKERATAGSEPTVTITGPGGEKITVKKGPVHPNTNFDRVGSRGVSPNLSDSEELRDIRHAQSLAIYASPIDNITPQRAIRNILRGDYRGIQDEAKAKRRKTRTYFVATDLSEEAAYALEWTIGTVLRDGDTLLAIYAIDEETGTGKMGDPDRIDGLELSEGAKAMQDTTATMEKLTSETPRPPPVSQPGPGALAAIGFGTRARRDSEKGSKDGRLRTKDEAERLHAIDMIGETCMELLRKTRLQVRVTVEVISCKSPRHLITEAIDFFEPTMVILGSRGRGALKGTLLGSFSNYLVAKSSIPVMVARKKLRGRKAKNVNPTVRLANNLIPTADSRLTRARID